MLYGRISFCVLITISLLFEFVAIISKGKMFCIKICLKCLLLVWDSTYIWNLNSKEYSINYCLYGAIMITISIIVHLLILINMLLTLSPDKPIQAATAMFRSSAVALYPVGVMFRSILNLGVRGCGSAPLGYIFLVFSAIFLMSAIVVGFLTAYYMKKQIRPSWNSVAVDWTFVSEY